MERKSGPKKGNSVWEDSEMRESMVKGSNKAL